MDGFDDGDEDARAKEGDDKTVEVETAYSAFSDHAHDEPADHWAQRRC